VPLVNGQTMFRMGGAAENRPKRTPVTADHGVTNSGLNISK
jgi:hypothetical protein